MAVPGQVTNPDAVEGKDITYQSEGATIRGYHAGPRKPGRYPGIIVIEEIFGVNEHIRDVTRRFANLGYLALAPELFSRLGGLPPEGDMEAARRMALSLADSQVVKDLEGAAAFLRAQPGASGKVGSIGFCFGGRESLLFGCNSDKVDAAVDCWGGSIDRASPDQLTTPQRPKPVIDMVGNLHCPLYVISGAEDQNPSPAIAEELRRRLEKAGKKATVEIFANAGHAFFADYRPSYREKAAFEMWPKVVSFFASHLR
jgi:carboxymethylenebutenolidase